jgi:hypothetical protein
MVETKKLLTKIICANVATVLSFDSTRNIEYPCIKTYNGVQSVLTELFDNIVNGNDFDLETISQLARNLTETQIVVERELNNNVETTYVSFPKLTVSLEERQSLIIK